MKLRSGKIIVKSHPDDESKYTFVTVEGIKDLKVGDWIRGITLTNSQKYLNVFGYEDCNATYEGVIIDLGNDPDGYEVTIRGTDDIIRHAIKWVGTSGGSMIQVRRLSTYG